MAASVHIFRCREDSYGMLVHNDETGATASIDAPDAAAIEDALEATEWKLTEILITHHHAKHVEGINALKRHHRCRVIGSRRDAALIPNIDVTVAEPDIVVVGALICRVLNIPGHTDGHVCYWFKAEKLAFVGDTLFSLGCGMPEVAPALMWRTLIRLRNLPPDTQIYCGHERTVLNLQFALSIEPHNTALLHRAKTVIRLAEKKQPTIPVTVAQERQTNPFLRADLPSVASQVGMHGAPAARVFKELVERRKLFRSLASVA